jgi:DNA-directed RNA polymerase specialized sigma24 family protein
MATEWSGDQARSLLERMERGDVHAMASLYDRYAGVVYAMALRVLCDPVLAEQVLLDVFLETWHRPNRLMQITGDLSVPLAMIARNRAVSLRCHKPATEIDFASPHWIASAVQCNMTRAQACAAMQALPLERRTVLVRALFDVPQQQQPDLPVSEAVSRLANTGLEVIDLQFDAAFARRRLHVHDAVSHVEGMNRLAQCFVESPETILQELVASAVDLCGADSAGISIEEKDSTDENFYHWVATAGQYSGFVNARLPRYPSACGVTLERARPQIFRVSQQFFDSMGIQAPTVTDGLLFPWQIDQTRGTIWIMAHGRQEAFDSEDCRMMQALANFAATGVRLQQQQHLLMERAATAATAALANELAHQINNPLQGLMQTVFLFGRGGADSGAFAQQAMKDLVGLSTVVKRLLSLPG